MDDITQRLERLEDKMDKRLDRLESKMDKTLDSIASMDVTSAENVLSLKEHMRRTALAEDSIELIRSDIKPIQKHVTMVNGILKFIGIVCLILGTIAAIVQAMRS